MASYVRSRLRAWLLSETYALPSSLRILGDCCVWPILFFAAAG